MFYIIDNNNIMIAGNETALIDYSCEIKKLPEDYEEGKYIVVDGELVLNPDWEEEHLDKSKQAKVQENDTARDAALNAGVVYKDVLFDSDTDQKVNLLATIGFMSDEDTVNWFGKDNQMLVCNKVDLLNIGNMIIQLHSYCWTKNAEIKAAINNAKTMEELNSIEIDYTIKEE